MNLVKITEPVYAEPDPTIAELELEVQRNDLLIQEMQIGKELNTLHEALRWLHSNLETINKLFYDEVQDLVRELKELEEKASDDKVEAIRRAGIETDVFNAHLNASREQSKKLSDSLLEVKKASSHAKKLFRKICSRTHPDKTSDPFLHELFAQARIFLSRNDQKGLESILQCIFQRKTFRMLRLEEEIKEITTRVVISANDVLTIRNSVDYQMVEDLRSSNPHIQFRAINYHKTLLSKKAEHIKSQIRAYDPTRYSCAPINTTPFPSI